MRIGVTPEQLDIVMVALRLFADDESKPDAQTMVAWDLLVELEDTYNIRSREYYYNHAREEKCRRARERYHAKQAEQRAKEREDA